jgi:hypothetical protein
LQRKGISDVLVIDTASEGQAGPWARYARMRTLRTPKNIKWPTWGVPAASPRAWFDARYGEAAWDEIDYFPTHDWHAFLEWYRGTLGIAVRFETAATRIRARDDSAPFDSAPFDVELTRADGGVETVAARRVVLATVSRAPAAIGFRTSCSTAYPDIDTPTRTTTSTSDPSRASASGCSAAGRAHSTTRPRRWNTGLRARSSICDAPRCLR